MLVQLIILTADRSTSKVARLVEGESSHCVTDIKPDQLKFEWHEEYFAVSVSESMINNVREYIQNEKEHRRVKLFMEEYRLFMKKYGLHIGMKL